MKFFLLIFFVMSFLLKEGHTQEAIMSSYSNIAHNQVLDSQQELPVSKGVSITQVIRPDETKEVTIHLREYPSSNRPWKYNQLSKGVSDHNYRIIFNDLIAPSITLSLHQKMVLKFDTGDHAEKFLYYLYFDKQKTDLSILQPHLITFFSGEYAWNNEPLDDSSWALWHVSYFDSWLAKGLGSILLSFQGDVWVTDNDRLPFKLKVPVTIEN